MSIATVHLQVFSPNRHEEGTAINITHGAIWCVAEDTNYQYDTMTAATPINAFIVRGVPSGVSTVTFGKSVKVEIQE